MTTAEKTNQKAAVTDEVDKGKKAIDQAPDVEGVNQAKADGIKKIDDQHQAGTGVDIRKDQAKKDLDTEATKVQGEIDNDSTLTTAEKTNQKAAVTDEVDKGKKAIDQAKDIDGVNQVKADGIKKIDDQHQPGTGVDVRKDQAKKDLETESTKVQGEIDADPTLTTAEKTSQKAAVATETTKAKTAIDQAPDVEGVNQAKADGIKKIDNQHQIGTGVTIRKPQVTKVQSGINNGPKLTTIKKTKQNGDNIKSEKNQKSVHSDSKSEKELPKTGEKQSNSTAMFGILLSIGSGMIFWKKKKESE